jgi:CRP-like cAMP-binding protein
MAQFTNIIFCSDCKSLGSIFSVLTPEELNFISENKHEVLFNPGETIFKQGRALTHIACINSGTGKIYIEGVNKKNLILKIIRPSDFVIGPGLFKDQRHHYSVSAATQLSACFIDAKAVIKLVKSNTKFSHELLKTISNKSVRNFDMLINLTQKHMPGRIADTLLYLSEQIYKSLNFTVDISRQDLADMSAMSKESAIRIIKEFKDAKYIQCEGNHFSLKDPGALKKLSQSG